MGVKRGRPPKSVPAKITDYLRQQVGVDLTPYTTETTQKLGGGVVLDWKHIPRRDQTRIISAINAPGCPYRMEWWSAWQNVIYRRVVTDQTED